MIILETERLLFRPHEPGDRGAYCAMEQDPDVRRYVGGAPRTREAAEAKFQAVLEAPHNLLRLWATVLKADRSYIGRSGLYPHLEGQTAIPGEGVLAFYLARQYWGQGLATEAALAFVKFENLKLKKIVATVEIGNHASARILQKLKFELVWREEAFRTFDHFALLRPNASEVK
jgi:[ribosomal protein S5]-alanine N-acetyltransferase